MTARSKPRSTRRKAPAAIPVPDPGLTQEGMVERARAMRHTLQGRQAEQERAVRILPETNQECVDAGFYRALQPRRFGGYEFDLPTFAKVMIELSRGCPSTGWVVAFTAGHTHVLAKYSEQAQVEAYAADGELRAPFVGGLTATATSVEGGYVINGKWDYASGCDTATHFLGACRLEGDGEAGRPGMLIALFDRDDFEIERNWEMLGLLGTGSHRVVVKDTFVPGHRVTHRNLLLPAADPGADRVHPNPMYLGPSSNVLMAEIAAVAVGTGYGALDCFEEILKTRTAPFSTTRKRFEEREFQLYFGQALAMLDTARDALIGCTQDFMDYCRWESEGKERFDAEKGARIVLVEQQCCRLAGEAVQLMVRTSGTSEARPGRTMQRYHRDMSTLLTHHTLLYDRNQEAAARLHFGLEQPTPAIGSQEAGARSAVAP
jgi:3-hydroxy-9,10-secoandrosta-1,3,5(10)-triene-9,17-dione monooxygenase